MYPSGLNYRTALINEMFPVQENGGYTFHPIMENDEPVYSSGGSAIVFKVADPKGEKFALKLFTREAAGRQERLRVISEYLQKQSLNNFTNFNFIEKLIYVEIPGLTDEQCYFPGVVMKWLEGKTLDEKLKELISKNKLNNIRDIADNFRAACFQLLKSGIAHGDLKASNIIIDSKLKLHFIDYDGMFIPALKNEAAIENGTPAYQHPMRSMDEFNEKIDHFPMLMIYYSLLIASEKPDIYLKYYDGDNIIFNQSDLQNPTNSELFELLESENIFPDYLYFIRKSLKSKQIGISNLASILEGEFPRPKLKVSISPPVVPLGEEYSVIWKSQNADFLTFNGADAPLSGVKSFKAVKGHTHSFSCGYGLNIITEQVTIETYKAPEILEFSASNLHLKENESVTIKWRVAHTDEVHLIIDGEEQPVKKWDSYTIKSINADKVVTLRARSADGPHFIEKFIHLHVCYPIGLQVEQDKKVTLPDIPVKLKFHFENADKVKLMPDSVDITDKSEHLLYVKKYTLYTIEAKNKRYTESFKGEIGVLPYPVYDKKIVNLPDIRVQLPEFKIDFPKFPELSFPDFDSLNKPILETPFFDKEKKTDFFKLFTLNSLKEIIKKRLNNNGHG
jgi:tRNA A-37 threonylcarbamoyl transferase component Bud32